MKILKELFLKHFSWLFLLIIFLASTWSLYRPGFFRIHDFTQAARIAEMGRALAEGQFPVRWSNNFGFGFGMPLFNFYAPLPYYLAGLLFNLGLNVILCLKILYLLPTLIGLIGAFKLGKKINNRWTGIILAAAYTLVPYRAVNLFVRGAVSEAWAMAFMPWVLDAIFGWLENLLKKTSPKQNYLILLISLVGIFLSHNLTALMFIPLSGLLAFALILRQENWSLKKTLKKIWPLFLIYLLSAMLSAFYLLPAVMEKDKTIIEVIFSGYFQYFYHFLYIRQFFKPNFKYGGSVWGIEDDMSFFLGWGQILGLLVVGFLFISILINKLKNKELKKLFKDKNIYYSLLFGIMATFALLMSLFKTQFIWDRVSILQYIQFPWRWLSVASLAIAVLLALSTLLVAKKRKRFFYNYFLFLAILINSIYFKPERYLNNPTALYYSDPGRIQNEMSGILPDYIPEQMADYETLKEANQNLDAVWVTETENPKRLFVLVDRGHEKLIRVELDNPGTLNFKIAYFPGWIAELDGEEIGLDYDKKLGNIQVSIPSGDHKLGLYFSEKTPSRMLGNSLSILGFLISLFYFSPFLERKDKKH